MDFQELIGRAVGLLVSFKVTDDGLRFSMSAYADTAHTMLNDLDVARGRCGLRISPDKLQEMCAHMKEQGSVIRVCEGVLTRK